jgi:hypothetical protein
MGTFSLLFLSAILLFWWLRQCFHSATIATVIISVIFFALLVGGMGMIWSGVPLTQAHYRVVANVEVDGVTKAASSIHLIQYVSGLDKGKIATRLKGSAPIIDLGEYGTLAVALVYDPLLDRERGGSKCPRPANFRELFEQLVDNVNRGNTIESTTERDARVATLAKNGPLVQPPHPSVEGTRGLSPAFIWFPPNASFMKSQQLCPEEFSRIIGGRIALKSVTIEVVSQKTPIDIRIAEAMPWLTELRQTDHDDANRLRSQLETGDYWQWRSIAAKLGE